MRKLFDGPSPVYRQVDIPAGYTPVTDLSGRVVDKYISETYLAQNPAEARQKLQKLASETALNMDPDAEYALIISPVISQVRTNFIKKYLLDEVHEKLEFGNSDNSISYKVSANVRAYK